MTPRRVLVTGSRDWTDAELVASILEGYWKNLPATVGNGPRMWLIEGGAKGADACAAAWADGRRSTVEHLQFVAHWGQHHEDWCPGSYCRDGKPYCMGAGPRRNKEMIQEAYPDLVIGFKDEFDWTLKRGGTEDCVRRTKANGISYFVVGRCA